MNPSTDWKKKFITLSIGQIFSIIGSSAAQFAIIWWLTMETGSAVTLSIASLVGFLPEAVLGPFVGVWVDRYDRKKIMMLADSFVALVSAGLALAFLLGVVTLPVIYIVLFLRALGSTFHGTAYQTVIPAFVPQEALVKAGGWGAMARSGAGLLGPVIGAFLMGVASMPVIMAVDIVGAVLAVGSLAFIHVPPVPPGEPSGGVLADMKVGLRALTGNRQLVTLMFATVLTVAMANSVSSLLSLMVTEHFGGGVWHNSTVRICLSAGVLIGSAILGLWGGGKRQFLLFAISVMVWGMTAALGGLMPGNMFVVFAGLMFVSGLVNSGINVPYFAYIQRTIEPGLLGKVTSLISSVNSASVPLGLAIAGPVAEVIGIANWYVVAGSAVMVSGLLLLAKSKAFDAADTGAAPPPA